MDNVYELKVFKVKRALHGFAHAQSLLTKKCVCSTVWLIILVDVHVVLRRTVVGCD